MGAGNVRTIAELRQDIRFTVDYGMGRRRDSASYLYNLVDLLVQVRWMQNGIVYERYGVLVDFEDEHERFGEMTYILEIPTSETDPKKVAAAQAAKIKQYIDEMRGEWKRLLDHVGGGREPMLVGYWDKLRKWLDSADGRWDVLRAFQHNTMPGTMPVSDQDDRTSGPRKTPSTYKSFFDWLVAREPDLAELQRRRLTSAAAASPSLQRFWMPLQAGQSYEIFVDWAVPYITYHGGWRVSHFATDGGAEELFYPFHNFQYPGLPGTSYTPPPARSRRNEEVRLRPTHYAPFAFWTYLIERIDLMRQQAYELLRPYYTYVTNLGLIQSVFANYGPLRNLDTTQIESLGREAEQAYPRWGGNVGDSYWTGSPGHEQHIALGMRDIAEAQRLFAGVIKKEAVSGRTGNLNVQVDAACFDLAKSLFCEPSRRQFEDLWAHNRDIYGYDLYLEKAGSLIAQSAAASKAYDDFFRPYLYEHPMLDDPRASADSPPDGAFWAGSAYRSVGLTLALWNMFYHVREKRVVAAARRSAPSSAAIAKWFREWTPSRTGSGQAITWWLHDKGQRKLANYLLGGGKLAQLEKMEAQILVDINRIVGSRTSGAITGAQVKQLREQAIKAHLDRMMRGSGIDPDRPTRVTAPIQIALNLYILGVTISAADSADWSGEAKYAVVAATVGLASDGLAYMAFRLWKIQGSLSRSALSATASTMGRGAAGTSLALGALEGLGGGVGGLLGIVWYAYSGVTDFQKGHRKDAILDAIAAVGVAVTMVGLFLDSTVVGVVPGIICNVVGICMLAIAEVIKIFSLWQNQPEQYVEALYTGGPKDTPAGCQRLRAWFADFGASAVTWDWEGPGGTSHNVPRVKALTERLDAMLIDMDTFDKFASRMD